MTYPARTVRHPNRQDEVGRDLIVRRTRDALRERSRTQLSRQEIADYAGVTPALISYYFLDRASLFEAAIELIIEAYYADVRRVIKAKQCLSDKLRSMIELYLTFHYREGHLLDFYVKFAKQSEGRAGLKRLVAIEAAGVALVGELLDRQYLSSDCPHAVQSILWRMCKQVSRRPITESATGSPLDERIRTEATQLYDVFKHGVALLFPEGPAVYASQAAARDPIASCRLR